MKSISLFKRSLVFILPLAVMACSKTYLKTPTEVEAPVAPAPKAATDLTDKRVPYVVDQRTVEDTSEE